MAHIYKIINTENNAIVYIGTTTKSLHRRLIEHKARAKYEPSKFYRWLNENRNNVRIEEITEVVKEKMHEVESFYISAFSMISRHLLNTYKVVQRAY